MCVCVERYTYICEYMCVRERQRDSEFNFNRAKIA